MKGAEPLIFTRIQFYTFAVFVSSSTFSIAISQMAFGLSLILFLSRIIMLRDIPGTIPNKLYFCISLYIAWMVIASLAGNTPVASLLIMKEEWLFAIIPVGLAVMSDAEDRKKLLIIFSVSVLVMSIYGIIQSQTGWQLLKLNAPRIAVESGTRISGNFSHPLTYANYFGVAAAFLFGAALSCRNTYVSRQRMYFIVATILAVSVILLARSRITIPALLVVIIVAGLLMGRRYYLPLFASIVILLSSLFFVPGLGERFVGSIERETSESYEAGRFFIWSRTLSIIKENPFLGVGQGNFAPEYTALLRPDIPDNRKLTHAHNDLLNVAAICGIPGAIFFAAFFVTVLVSILRKLRHYRSDEQEQMFLIAAFLATIYFIVASLTEATFADEEVRQLLMFIWAAGLSVTYNSVRSVEEISG